MVWVVTMGVELAIMLLATKALVATQPVSVVVSKSPLANHPIVLLALFIITSFFICVVFLCKFK